MGYDPSQQAGGASGEVTHQVIAPNQREQFFQQLMQQGWIMVGSGMQFPGTSDPNTLRFWALEYAKSVGSQMVVEVNDPSISTEPSNTLIFFMWRMQGAFEASGAVPSQQAAQQPQQQAGSQPIGQAPYYPNPEQVLEQLLWKLVNMLFQPNHPFQFQDTGELLHPFVGIQMECYEHLGGRKMDLYMLKDGIYDYKIIGNEAHGTSGGKLTPFRDEIISMKTLSKPAYMILNEFSALDQDQKNRVVYAIHLFLSQY